MLIELNSRDLFNRAYFFKAFLAEENSLKIWKLPLEVYDAAQVSNTLFFCVYSLWNWNVVCVAESVVICVNVGDTQFDARRLFGDFETPCEDHVVSPTKKIIGILAFLVVSFFFLLNYATRLNAR